jgi:MSHA biogenesis protein MshP
MALISALFLVIVLVALGAAMVTMSNVEHDTGTKSVVQARAYYGARAGLDWAIQQAVAADACAAIPPTTFSLTQGALSGIAVEVTCVRSTHGAGNFVFYLTSTARSGAVGEQYYAERRLEATVGTF